MGLKMKTAYSEKLEKVVGLNDVNKDNRQNLTLKCASRDCRADITYTEEHIRTYGDVSVHVPAYFRLKSEKNNPHTEECMYSTIGELKSLAKKSKTVLKQLDDDKIEFRLQFLTDDNPKKNSEVNEKNKSNLRKSSVKSKGAFTKSGSKSAYLSTVQKVMSLKSKLDDNRELERSVIIKRGKKQIKWEDFYIEKNSYYSLYKKLEGVGLSHPICLEGVIKNIKFEKDNNRGSIELYRPSSTSKKNRPALIPSVFINFYGETLYNEIKKKNENKEYITVYSEKISTSKRKLEDKVFLNLSVKVVHKNQLYLWD